jgi:hypothetical protein
VRRQIQVLPHALVGRGSLALLSFQPSSLEASARQHQLWNRDCISRRRGHTILESQSALHRWQPHEYIVTAFESPNLKTCPKFFQIASLTQPPQRVMDLRSCDTNPKSLSCSH